jgi:hypothetical protein
MNQSSNFNLRLIFHQGQPLFELDGFQAPYLCFDDQIGEEIVHSQDPWENSHVWGELIIGIGAEKTNAVFNGKIKSVVWGGNGINIANVEELVNILIGLMETKKDVAISDIVEKFCLTEGYIEPSSKNEQLRMCCFVSLTPDRVGRLKYRRC